MAFRRRAGFCLCELKQYDLFHLDSAVVSARVRCSLSGALADCDTRNSNNGRILRGNG